jgi:hypothetical protein
MPVLEVYERIRVPVVVLNADVALPTCTPADPFGIDHDCINPAGHDFIAACGDVACCHCAKVVWQ